MMRWPVRSRLLARGRLYYVPDSGAPIDCGPVDRASALLLMRSLEGMRSAMRSTGKPRWRVSQQGVAQSLALARRLHAGVAAAQPEQPAAGQQQPPRRRSRLVRRA